MAIDGVWVRAWIVGSAATIAEHRGVLTLLDREIGDGDHGENLNRGFEAVLITLDELDASAPPGAVLKLVATTLISTVGGAAGPLYGTAFLRAAVTAAGAVQLDSSHLAAVLVAARDGVVARGKAEPGDKTMIDAWTPAVGAAENTAAAGGDTVAVLNAAANAAARGAAATELLVARKGRASYLGARSVGHRDPGAESTSLILQAAAGVPS